MALKETLERDGYDFAHSAISLLRAVYVVPLKEPIAQALACNQTYVLSP